MMKFGLHRIQITPPSPMPMGGYAGRVDPFDCVHDPLFFTAVYLNDGQHEAWIGSADLVQFPDSPWREAGLQILTDRLKCRPESLFLNASHTHGGPLIRPDHGVENIYTPLLHGTGQRDEVLRYYDFLWQRVGDALEAARADAQPGSLRFAQGKTSFAINRRKEVDGKIVMAPNPAGKTDDRLRLLLIDDAQGNLRIMLPILACHPTSTSSQHQITADFVGAWRKQVEDHFHGRVTMAFLQGCCGDIRGAHTANGDGFRIISHHELAEVARPLFHETLAVLQSPSRQCGPLNIRTAVSTIQLPCEHTYARRQNLDALLSHPDTLMQDYARTCLNRLDRGEPAPDQAAIRLQALQLTDQLLLLGFDIEPLCGLGRAIETSFEPAHQAIVLGYVNGCSGYVPDDEELPRGGYETESYLWRPWTGPFQPGVNRRLIDGFRQLSNNLHP